jgi:hypothetical protein
MFVTPSLLNFSRDQPVRLGRRISIRFVVYAILVFVLHPPGYLRLSLLILTVLMY